MFPIRKNMIFVRFENIADLFDYDNITTLNDTCVFIAVKDFALDLYKKVNGDQAGVNAINIIETSLTGN